MNGVRTTHVWDGAHMAAELNASGVAVIRFTRGRGGRLIHSQHHGWYLHNARGDVVQRVNGAGATWRAYRYTAFGVELNPVANPNPFRFAGEYYDAETGRIYLRARFYDPRLGRFTQPDPFWGIHNMQNCPLSIMQAGNLFVYTINNPVMWIDPSGLRIEYRRDHLGRAATSAQILQYRRAIEYLSQSATFRGLYDFLQTSGETVYISFNNQMLVDFRPSAPGWMGHGSFRAISWDPTAGGSFGISNNVVSPALALAHEFGHVQQYLTGGFDAFFAATTPVGRSSARTAIETDNLTRWETPIATDLGEFTRAIYGRHNTMHRVGSSTDWGVMVSDPGILPWHWNNRTFENHNTWIPAVTQREGFLSEWGFPTW